MHRTRALVAWTFIASLPATAAASGISVARFGGEHGTPMTSEPTAIYYNPAGIAGSRDGHAYADVTLALRHTTYDRAAAPTDAAAPAGAEGANVGSASLLNLVASPFFGVTYRIGDLALGAAYYTPFGGQSSWSGNDAYRGDARFPGAVDGVQRWYSIDGELRTSFASFAAAYHLDRVNVGLSANLMDTIASTLRARDPTGGNDVRNEGRSWLDARGLDFGFGVGVQVDVVPEKVQAALSYQSRPGVTSNVRASGDLHTVFANGNQNDNRVDFLTALPDVLRAGVSFRPREEVELRLFGDYQRWHFMRDQCVVKPGAECALDDTGAATSPDVVQNQRRNWHDTFGVRTGASYFPSKRLELLGGLGFGSNAVPDSTQEPALPDFHAITAAVGVVGKLGDRLQLSATYTEAIYLPRDTTGKNLHPTLGAASRGPDSGGKYAQLTSVLNLNVDVRF